MDKINQHKHLIKYLKAIKPELVQPGLDNCLKLKLINKTTYKLILKEVMNSKLTPNLNFPNEGKKITIAEYENELFHIPNKEYLDSIDPKELEEAKKMFSNFKSVPDIENIFEDFNERLTKDNN